MTYIELINQFWALNREHSFTPNEISLYFALLDICHSLGWRNPFNQSSRNLATQCNLNEKTLTKARNYLKQAGLIEFKSGDGRRNNTVYTLKGGKIYHLSDHLSPPLSDHLSPPLSDHLSGQNDGDNIILDIKEYKEINKESNLSILESNVSCVLEDKVINLKKEKEKFKKEKEKSCAQKDKERLIIPPTLEMVAAYCVERGNDVVAQKFIDYYESRGWNYKTGQKMKDWQAAVRTWEGNEFNNKIQQNGNRLKQTKGSYSLSGTYSGTLQD